MFKFCFFQISLLNIIKEMGAFLDIVNFNILLKMFKKDFDQELYDDLLNKYSQYVKESS